MAERKSDEWKEVWRNEVMRPYLELSKAHPTIARDPKVRSLIKRIGQYVDGVLREMDKTEEIALVDSLTQIPNRRAFNRDMEREVNRAARYGRPLSLIIADGNGFKEVNDTQGHEGGDVMICRMGEVAVDSFRETDSVTRYGGDEFSILLPETETPKAVELAKRFHYNLASAGCISVSQGIDTYRPPKVEKDKDTRMISKRALGALVRDGRGDLFAQADRALYKAKEIYKSGEPDMLPIVAYHPVEMRGTPGGKTA